MDIKFSEIGSSLEAELASMSAMQQAQNDSFTKVCEGIVDFAKEENAAQDKRAMKTFQDFDDACASLDRKFSEAVQRQDERMDDLRGVWHKRNHAHARDQADPKLVYFDARGVVEPTRLLLAAAGVKYEDKRYAVDMTTKPPVWRWRVRSHISPAPARPCCVVRSTPAGLRPR